MKNDRSINALRSILAKDRSKYELRNSKHGSRPINSSDLITNGERPSLFLNLKQMNAKRDQLLDSEIHPVTPVIFSPDDHKEKTPKDLKKRAEGTALYHSQKILKTIKKIETAYENLIKEESSTQDRDIIARIENEKMELADFMQETITQMTNVIDLIDAC